MVVACAGSPSLRPSAWTSAGLRCGPSRFPAVPRTLPFRCRRFGRAPCFAPRSLFAAALRWSFRAVQIPHCRNASGSPGARRRRLPTPAGASGRGLLWQGVNALGKGFSISWFCRVVPALTSGVGPGSELPAPVGFSCQLRLCSFPMNHTKKKKKKKALLPPPQPERQWSGILCQQAPRALQRACGL